MPRCCLSHRVQLWLAILTICVAYAGADILVFSTTAKHQITEFRDAPARFGGLIPVEGIKGMVVYADPPTACNPIAEPPNIPNYDGKWIVLIARYNCTFEEKIRMAQAANYDAAIIHNIGSNEIEQMSAKNPSGIGIPSVFVGEDTGAYLRSEYLYDQYFILINDDLPFNINTRLLLPFAIVVGICFLVMVIFMIVQVIKCIKDRRRQRRHRLPNSSLKKIPTHKYTKGDPYETCAICLEDYAEGEKLRVLPCAHAYHTKCIDPWLTKNRRVCPVCKRKVFATDERVTDSESDTDVDDSTPLIRDGHQGTQGGTFTPQRDNPFTRASRNLNRSGSNSSNSSLNSERQLVSADDGENGNNGESSRSKLFVVSDSHSINGEPPELERSASSTKPHTVNLDTQDVHPVIQIVPVRNPRILVNPVAPNSGHPIMVPTNPLPIPTILSEEHERNDYHA
ncbi:E3 ubiquitin-protein ligase RNF13-like isoform X1 [Neodiprion fabricii]|uniref:E3 ubiquitin-protein ligase RNF13-like isoform X1 n=1 Tax=Neodiprion fabricii TaxID=2872261 RepID=UPI001ED94AE6|nr:E3 ubiquitin-protein ligase RNF13-like isoform X1 [Neodiprion fabricii]XP_046415838.1 E3 ubiquitin-protein ligase RNF13-like isoform X1 [Neodiprion fabricii]XP_046415839.1 E3 ubiquitin-protein ligase RNF13-like isoform X1 [Neodiprion fabricii]XP_046415840.1 E3 ubiquitin-protein ligase RNF13-like isoform X1 [Neodiprion fabricii]XP_046415842.1 E3 ubiquitin-protein ligase RNF13-like isoform X1 [Neodiprion fabricii]XP_046415843.1 E3 ubiquitin-protein ligase RNF13-like isoform X1 [Neodiprion fab